jgi:hypothetical protein
MVGAVWLNLGGSGKGLVSEIPWPPIWLWIGTIGV